MTPKKYFRIIITISVCLVMIGGGGYWYGLTRLSEASSTLAAQNTMSQTADNRIANLKNTELHYHKEIEPILGQINEALPAAPNQTKILAQLQVAAKTTGAVLSAVSFEDSQGVSTKPVAAGVTALPMSFQVVGSYAQAQAFLAEIENLSRLTTVDSLTASNTNGTITYAIHLTAYSKP